MMMGLVRILFARAAYLNVFSVSVMLDRAGETHAISMDKVAMKICLIIIIKQDIIRIPLELHRCQLDCQPGV